MPQWIAEAYAVHVRKQAIRIKTLEQRVAELEAVVGTIGDSHEGYMVLRQNTALQAINKEIRGR